MPSGKLVDRAEEIAEILALLGNGKRLAILCHIADTELSVGAIAERVELSQSALSQHLAKLRNSGLVRTRRDKQMIYYSCADGMVASILTALDDILADGLVRPSLQ
ncbi:MAG: winged helix-turn-helix transcriptional regulator [Rhizobiales bacterium]|jgi:DNA-binding transcriptional ArsR family regulator|nr:winged helix-turn-helix transcriptional regulator [Hyphomicrobiales bacterium]OJU31619.1 MAG: ArsR family transcriptional regulator [Rhizobiales bacterium 68-8]